MRKPAIFPLFVFLASIASASFFQSPSETPVQRLEDDTKAGLESWQTMLGNLWIPSPGEDVIKHLQWEQVVERVYHHPLVHVRPGDVVIDCGAHIGAFTRVAMRTGAHMVVAIEPEQTNLLAFQRNFEKEMKAGQVKLVAKGMWNTTGKLPLPRTGSRHRRTGVFPSWRYPPIVPHVGSV